MGSIAVTVTEGWRHQQLIQPRLPSSQSLRYLRCLLLDCRVTPERRYGSTVMAIRNGADLAILETKSSLVTSASGSGLSHVRW